MKTLTNLFIRLFLLTVITTAQWSSDPSLPQLIGTGIQSQVAPTSDGGVYIAWLTDGNYHVYIQRFNAAGEAQLDESGLLVSDNNNASWIAVYHLNLAVDGNDNAIITTVDQRTGPWEVYAWKISPNGAMVWGDDGIAITNSSTSNMSPRLTIVPDNSIVVTCTHNDNMVFFQRISSDGELLWGDGIILEDDTRSLISPQSIINTDDDIIFQWLRQSSGWPIYSEIFIQKFDLSGVPIWTNPSLIVGPVSFPMGNWSQQLLAAPNGGCFIAWTELSGNVQNAIAETVSNEGVSLWDGGIDLSTNFSNFRMSPMLSVSEETQELMALWRESNGSQSQRGISAQRLDNSGNRLWGDDGITVVDMNPDYDYLDLSVVGFGEEIISAYIQQSANMSGDIYAKRLDAEGNSVWTEETVTVTNSGMAKSDMMTSKGPNCVFITWSENGSVYAHCLREDGTLGVPDVDSSDCIADDGTDGVELWGECYSIENTDSLDLSESGLTGSIPPEIGNLTNLEFLYLNENQLTGSIPSEIGSLTNLTHLNLKSNQLTGEIPSEIGNMTNLTWVKLWYNQLTGNIPESLWDLVLLEYIDFDDNQLTGTISENIENLTNLTVLALANNQLSGEIPSEIWTLTNLNALHLPGNEFTGSIQSEIGNLTNLTYLNLSTNQLTGYIPAEIGNLTNLENLFLDWNQFTGSIPSEIGNLTNLEDLNFGENDLTGPIPQDIGILTNLKYLNIGENELTGEIPPEIGNLTNLESIHLFQNQLSGEIPSEIENLTNLIYLNIGENELTGEIPEGICALNINWSSVDSSNVSFNISNNQLCPPYPECVEDYVGEQDTSNCEQVSIIDETLPISYNLHNAFPNPFNPATTLRYDIPEDGFVNITIYDLVGRQVKALLNSPQTAGHRSIQWNATNNAGQQVPAGVYLYSIETANFRQTKKMVLLK